jgi:hypothetical protein
MPKRLAAASLARLKFCPAVSTLLYVKTRFMFLCFLFRQVAMFSCRVFSSERMSITLTKRPLIWMVLVRPCLADLFMAIVFLAKSMSFHSILKASMGLAAVACSVKQKVAICLLKLENSWSWCSSGGI